MRSFALVGSIPWSALAAPRKPPPAIRLVVLDVGGTIIEDHGDVPKALSSALAHHGIPSSSAEIGQRRGASKREVIRYFVDRHGTPPEIDRDKLIETIHNEFTANLIEVYRQVPPIAGAGEAILQLRASGYLIAATTGFDRRITTSIFQRLGWEGNFAATICNDDVSQGRPAPFMIFHAMEAANVNSVAEVVAVGDTPLDMQAGTNAGVRAVVGVLTGAGTAETLREAPHTHIIASVADLPALLASKL